eukprot:scaffold238249_cov17-Tisochrysis_lutea.AAC.1
MPGRMRSAHTHTREAHRKPGQHAKLTSFVRGDHALCVRERVYLDRLDPMRAMAAALSRVAWRQDLRTKPETLHHRNAPRLSWSQCSMHGSPKAAKPVSIQRGSYVHIRNGAQQLQHGTATANAGTQRAGTGMESKEGFRPESRCMRGKTPYPSELPSQAFTSELHLPRPPAWGGLLAS